MTSPTDPLMRSVLGAASGGRHAVACPDAEVLALYAEQGLHGEERAGVEAHVAMCGLCQQALAGFVRSAPQPAAADALGGIVGWWRGWRWLVPLAATAGVAVVAVWIGRAPSEQAADMARGVAGSAVSETDALRAPSSAPAAPATSAAEAKEAPTTLAQAAESARANGGQGPRPLEKSKALSAPGAPPSAGQNAALGRADTTGTVARQALREASADTAVAVGRLADAAPEATARPIAPPSPAVAPRDADPATIQATPAPVGATRPPATADFAAPAAPAAPAAEAATADARFRAAAGGTRAEAEPARKTTEAGADTKSEVAGAAARDERRLVSPWRLRAGVVERTTDGGRSWKRVTVPTKEAVLAVSGSDRATATVTTASGATLRTTDGGATWRPVR